MEEKKQVLEYLNKLLSQKKIFIIISIIFAYLISVISLYRIIGYPVNEQSRALNIFAYPVNFLDRIHVSVLSLLVIPLFFVFSVILHFLSNRIFRTWRLWTGIWLILFFFASYIETGSGGGLGAVGNLSGLFLIPTYFLYILVSMVVIAVTMWREKHGK